MLTSYNNSPRVACTISDRVAVGQSTIFKIAGVCYIAPASLHWRLFNLPVLALLDPPHWKLYMPVKQGVAARADAEDQVNDGRRQPRARDGRYSAHCLPRHGFV
jgi:hypothetical protein